jgi:hypothetical protein
MLASDETPARSPGDEVKHVQTVCARWRRWAHEEPSGSETWPAASDGNARALLLHHAQPPSMFSLI